MSSAAATESPSYFMDLEKQYGAFNYAPLPVVLNRGEGVFVWDVEGKRYYDFLAAYSAVNQGHCHPRIVGALTEQAKTLTLTSRAFHNDMLGRFEEYITGLLGYDRVLPMNTGVEASETAVKLARRWAYDVKGTPENEAVVLFARNNFWGRSLAAVSASTDPDAYGGYGPLLPGFECIDFDDLEALEAALKRHGGKVAAFMVEPIQGEAGVVVPQDGYLAKAQALCHEHKALLICDEVQTGLCRTGKMLCSEWDGVKPDILALGKALSGGVYPVSAALASDEVMLTIKPGQHGSTYGGNPLACAVAMSALQVLVDENLAERSATLGDDLRHRLSWGLRAGAADSIVEQVRGRGLMNAIVTRPRRVTGDAAAEFGVADGAVIDASTYCLEMAKNSLLAKPTHTHTIRLAPPLVLTDEQLVECAEIIGNTLMAVEAKSSPVEVGEDA